MSRFNSVNFVLLFVGFVLTSVSQVFASPQEELADVIERCEKSVVRIEVKGKDGESLGSGFVVNSSGVIVTNVHVLAGAVTATATFADGKEVNILGTKYFDESRDICVAKIGSKKLKTFTPIKVSEKLPRKGETVTALGAPRGLSFTATNGIVSAIREGKSISPEYNGTWVQIDAALSPGNSGGPLINRSGHVVAMSTLASRGDSQNLNFGISADDIRDAISKAKKNKLKGLKEGIGKVDSGDGGGGGGGDGQGNRITKVPVPEKTLADYVTATRKDYAKYRKNFTKRVADASKEFSLMKRGRLGFPQKTSSETDVLVLADPRNRNKSFFFRNELVKEREVSRKKREVDGLKEAKSKIGKEPTKESLFFLMQNAGSFLDPREEGSIGFISSGTVLHAFNEHDVVVLYDEKPYFMWLPSTSGLSNGEKIKPTTAFVSGTETISVPRSASQSITVLLAVTDEELKKAIGFSSGGGDSASTPVEGQSIRQWTSGKYKLMAKLVAMSDENVTLRSLKGSDKVVPKSKLSQKDRDYLEQLK